MLRLRHFASASLLLALLPGALGPSGAAAQIVVETAPLESSARSTLGLPAYYGTVEVGAVRDLVLDRVAGEIKYAVIGVGGFLGLGQKLVAIAWHEITILPDRVEIPLSPEALRAAPDFAFRDQRSLAVGAPRRPPEGGDPAEYLENARQQIDTWGKRIAAYSERAKAQGDQPATEASQELQRAWTDVNERWRILKSAGDAEWEEARRRFEEAWLDLQSAWEAAEAKS